MENKGSNSCGGLRFSSNNMEVSKRCRFYQEWSCLFHEGYYTQPYILEPHVVLSPTSEATRYMARAL
jgi:hypothetical protein